MFSFSRLGKHGNLGNQLFEIASTIGLAVKHGVPYVFPQWQYSDFFEHPIPQVEKVEYDIQVNEPDYTYNNLTLDTGRRVDLLGWFQSEKYWTHCRDQVREYLWFKNDFFKPLHDKYSHLFNNQLYKPAIAMSVRRGDYVDNPNYHQLGLDYYLGALDRIKKDLNLTDFHVLVFSDDIAYCKNNLPQEFNFMEGLSAIEQLAIGASCHHFIIANSSFSWWMAYLGELSFSKVIAPAFWNAGELLKHSDDRDVVPSRWIRYNPAFISPEQKIDLRDVTFTIPIKYDHYDRKENLDLSLSYLQNYFDTNIIVGEMDKSQRFEYVKEKCRYVYFPFKKSFHRTWMLNEMARMAETPIIVNWDCDVFMHPKQILEAVNRIRTGQASMVYPYDGRFFRCGRNQFYEEFRRTLSFDLFKGKAFPESQYKILSYGGAIIWNKEDFFKGGAENEFMIHYGPEDFERYHRFQKLGYQVHRINGPLFHIDHSTANNGSNGHDYFEANEKEFIKVKKMSREELEAYVSTWPWIKKKEAAKPKEVRSPLMDFKIDHIYCLNLERRTDRKEYATQQFKSVGIENVHFFKAIDGAEKGFTHFDERITPGMIGCWKSHMEILSDALINKYETICVFEDDIVFIDGFNDLLNLALPQIPEDWNFAYLGCTEYGGVGDFKKQINNFWVVPKCAWGTQAYMIKGLPTMFRLYNWLLSSDQTRQLDEELANHILPHSGFKYYSIFPSAVGQAYEEMGTDVQKRG